MKQHKNTCGNCARLYRYTNEKGEQEFVCEECENSVGMPVSCSLNDEGCKHWTDDTNKKGKLEDSLRCIVDNFGNDTEMDDWDTE